VLCDTLTNAPDISMVQAPFNASAISFSGTGGGGWLSIGAADTTNYSAGYQGTPTEPSLCPYGGSANGLWLGAQGTGGITATISISFTNFYRTITMICPKETSNGGEFFLSVNHPGANNSQSELLQVVSLANDTNASGYIFQFSVPSSPVVFSFNNGSDALARNYPVRGCGVSAIFLD
jgi:hypothetical protein